MPLTNGQSRFAAELSRRTRLNPRAITAWMLAEENGSAAQQREAQGNHNWLNIGYYDSGAGALAHHKVFGTPESAARATADFIHGKRFGAGAGIQAIGRTAGKGPAATLNAVAASPWASSHYGGAGRLMSIFKTAAGDFPHVNGSSPRGPKLANVARQHVQLNVPVGTTSPLRSVTKTDETSALIDTLLSHPKTGLLHALDARLSSGAYTSTQTVGGDTRYTNKKISLKGPRQPQARGGGAPPGGGRGRGGSGHYVYPFGRGLASGRTDMGVDPVGKGNHRAIGDAVITRVQTGGTGWPGLGTMIVYRLTSGPLKGQHFYHAEDLVPKVHVGQHVRAGQVIAYQSNATGTNGEVGFASDGMGTTSSAHHGTQDTHPNHSDTPEGLRFARFIASLRR